MIFQVLIAVNLNSRLNNYDLEVKFYEINEILALNR